jgi:signal transduction histidine kinase/CheY-like chemotaxis protein
MGQLIFAGGDLYRPIGLTGFLYLAAITAFAYNTNKTIINSIRLRFENIGLIEELSAQKASAESSQRLAEAAIVAKSKFLAAASHDLRQPLHALGLFHDALEPHVDGGGGEIMDRMQQSISALGGLFDSLLDISRLDAGVFEVNRRHIRLRPLLRRLCDEHRPRAEEKGLALDYKGDEFVIYSDPVILERILRNLLSNAIRYTDAGSVTLECRPNNDGVRVSVADTGKGIDDGERESIFSEYHQLHNPGRDRTKGLGLGLSIVKRLCKLLGPEIQLESEVGKGSTFYLDLPMGDANAIESGKPTGAWDLRGAIVLVIDDEADILHSTGRVVERWGCKAVLAESAAEALDLVNESTIPSAIVADYRLSDDETGIQAIEKVRDRLGQHIPAMLISGDTAPERLQEVKTSGLRLLHKPVMPGELRTALMQELIDQKV